MKHKTAFAFLLITIFAGAYCSFRYYHDSVLPDKTIDEVYTDQLVLFESVKPKKNVTFTASDPLEPAEEVNDAVVGWITIDGTHIDFPICQAEDNDFYLHNGFDGKYNNELGCPFLDYRCEGDFSGFNSIVYGHNVNGQRMFADIALFREQDYLQLHPTGALTLKDGEHTVRFFAYMNVPDNAPAYHAVFVSAADREDCIDYIFSEAVYTSGHTADELKKKDDLHLLLLSTCTYEFTDARGILIGAIE